jgi:molybdate transport system substrate-binding protein
LKRLTAAALAVLLLLSACSSTDLSAQSDKNASVTLTVSAAASLHDVLKVLTRQYEQENKSVHININSASSGTLAKKKEQGAPADIYNSASKNYIYEI